MPFQIHHVLVPSFFLLLIMGSSCSAPTTGTTNHQTHRRHPTRAPDGPGEALPWTPGAKDAVSTAYSAASRVWLTLQGGILTEVYYPRLDQVATRSLELAVSDGHTLWLESRDLLHTVEQVKPQALLFRQVNRHPEGLFTLTKTIFTDPARDTVLMEIEFETQRPGYELYVLLDPALGHTTMTPKATHQQDALVAQNQGLASALVSSPPFQKWSNGYVGVNDGRLDLTRHRRLSWTYDEARQGHITQTAQLPHAQRIILALGFGTSVPQALNAAHTSLRRGAHRVKQDFIATWTEYLQRLRPVKDSYRRVYQLAAMVLQVHEDKTYPGASVAALSIPWGQAIPSDRLEVGGYHLVWSRDLYHVATAFLALGDRPAALRTLDYLLRVQQRPDGSFPQNTWIDGRPYWPSTQLDETAYPLILAWQLGRHEPSTWREHLRPAAEYILAHGPATPQDRWEEESGLSPSTIAAEIAALVCAADLARVNHDLISQQRYLAAADNWAAHLESWLVTKTGPLDDQLHNEGYYLRINNNTDPDDGFLLELNNGGGSWDEREIVDAGFLELVRLGIRPAHDAIITRSLAVVDATLRVSTPSGPAWYRYNHDGYGETAAGGPYQGAGVGRLWPLLTGERGEHAIARGEDATPYLLAMMGFANSLGMIPEQVWDRDHPPDPRMALGQGTGSASPLAWSMAQLIRLIICIEEGRIVEQPSIVAQRYAQQKLKHSKKSLAYIKRKISTGP